MEVPLKVRVEDESGRWQTRGSSGLAHWRRGKSGVATLWWEEETTETEATGMGEGWRQPGRSLGCVSQGQQKPAKPSQQTKESNCVCKREAWELFRSPEIEGILLINKPSTFKEPFFKISLKNSWLRKSKDKANAGWGQLCAQQSLNLTRAPYEVTVTALCAWTGKRGLGETSGKDRDAASGSSVWDLMHFPVYPVTV